MATSASTDLAYAMEGLKHAIDCIDLAIHKTRKLLEDQDAVGEQQRLLDEAYRALMWDPDMKDGLVSVLRTVKTAQNKLANADF